MGPKTNIYGINIIEKFTKKTDLLKYLSDLHNSLNVLSQDPKDRPKGLENTALQLISTQILDHSDKDVRLLSSCCIVDMLRVFAPDAPYGDEDMVRVFQLITTQLRGLSVYDKESTVGKQIVYILTNLSTVQSCVVPISLAQRGVDGADEVATAMFDSILSSLRLDHGDEIFSHCGNILQSCIEEPEEINQEILDTILFPLLSSSQKENPSAYKLIGTVLRKVDKLILPAVTKFIRGVLVGSGDLGRGERSSELAEHIYPLIFELHKISASLLVPIFPDLCTQLQAEDEEVRLQVVQLLGQLFASQYGNYAVDFHRNFHDFLGRFMDQSVQVRREVVRSCVLIGNAKPALNEAMEEPLAKHLRDPDADVRLSALNRLLDMGNAGPLALSPATLEEIGERAKDKKLDIRRVALVGLSRMYSAHVSTKLPPLSSLAPHGTGVKAHRALGDVSLLVGEDILSRFSGVPSVVVKSWGYPDLATKHLVLQLVQEQLLPVSGSKAVSSTSSSQQTSQEDSSSAESQQSFSCDCRATALTLLHLLLVEEDRPILGAILAFKQKVRNSLQALINARAAVKSAEATGGDKQASAMLKKLVGALVQLLPPVDKKTTPFDKLLVAKDKIIFRLLDDCLAFRDSPKQAQSHRDDLRRRLDSKSPTGEYFGLVYDFAAGLVANLEVVGALVRHVDAIGVHDHARDPLNLLVLLSKHIPLAFQSVSPELAQWLETCIECDAKQKRSLRTELLGQTMAVVSSTSAAYKGDGDASPLCETLVRHIKTHDSSDLCEKLAELLNQIAVHSADASPAALLKHLTSAATLSLANKRLHCDLSALSALIKVPAAAYQGSRFASAVFKAMMRDICAVGQKASTFIKTALLSRAEKFPSGSAVACVGASVKVATSLVCTDGELQRIQGTEGSPEGKGSFQLDQLMDIVFSCIACGGDKLAAVSAVTGEDRLQLAEVAALSAVSLIKLNKFASTISVSQWHSLGWTMLGPARSALLGELSRVIQTYPVHPQFLAYPCLFVTDDSLCAAAEQSLTLAVTRLRITHEELCSQVVASVSGSESDELQRLAQAHMPETVLPYALHLLSYHPEFPVSLAVDTEADRKKMRMLVKAVKFILRVLQNTLRNEANNQPFIFKQVNLIVQKYCDAVDKDNTNLQFVARVAAKALLENVKSSESLQGFNRDITLPAHLFVARQTAKGNKNEKQSSLDATEHVIDRFFKSFGNKGGPVAREFTVSSPLPAAKKARKSPGSGGAATKRMRNESLEEEGREDGDTDSPVAKTAAAKKSRTSAGSRSPAAETAPTRVVHRRGAKSAVSYREFEETEAETERWNAEAGVGAKRRASRSQEDRAVVQSSLQSGADDEMADMQRERITPAKSNRPSLPAADEEDLFLLVAGTNSTGKMGKDSGDKKGSSGKGSKKRA